MKLSGIIVITVVILLILAGGVGWLFLHTRGPTSFAGGTPVALADYHGPNPTGVSADLATADLVKRGEYLARAGDCAACHNAPGGKPFAGGYAFKLPFGTIYSSNITPDKETGIGGWTDEQIAAAITTGKRPDGRQLAPIMNYAAFTYMTKEDVAAVVAYLRSIPPVKNEVPGPFKPGEKVSIFAFRILPPGEIAAQAPK